MAFTIPNNPDAFNAHQAEVDKVDLDIIIQGIKGEGVVTGCAVTAQGSPDMTVAVAAGYVAIGGALAAVSSGNVTIGAADATNPRIDLITVNNSGTKACTAGTAAASPVFPAVPASSVAIAAVYVPATDTTIASNQITDKRVFVPGTGIGARVYNNTTQGITGSASVTFNSEDYDNLGCHDTGSNTERLVAPVAGQYHVAATVWWASNATGNRQLYVTRNSDSMIPSANNINPDDAIDIQQSVSAVLDLAAGDYVRFTAAHGAGGSLNIGTASSPAANQFGTCAEMVLLKADN